MKDVISLCCNFGSVQHHLVAGQVFRGHDGHPYLRYLTYLTYMAVVYTEAILNIPIPWASPGHIYSVIMGRVVV